MRIYEFRVQDGYEWVVPVDSADFEVFRGFDGTSRRADWKPVAMRLVTTDKHGSSLSESDVPWLGAHAPVMREQAVAVLGPLLAAHGEMLPLACHGANLVVLNVTSIPRALDLERSKIVRFPSSGRIMRVTSFAFRNEVITGLRAFKVPELLRGAVFVSGEVVEAAESAGLRGVGFRLLWEDG